MKSRRERLLARLARAQVKLAAAHAAVEQWQATCDELQAQLAEEEEAEEARSDGSVSGAHGGSDDAGSSGDDDGEEEHELSGGSDDDGSGSAGGRSEYFTPAPQRRHRSCTPEDVPGGNSDLEEPSDAEDDEPPAPPIPAPQEELAEEKALSAELGINVTELCDWVIKQVKPVEGELRFDTRKYVKTLLVATQRARLRHPEHEGFVFPPEVEQLVCGGATQARAHAGQTLWRGCMLLLCAARRDRSCFCADATSHHGPLCAPCAGGQDNVRGGRRRRRLRCTSAVRGASTTARRGLPSTALKR
jgi:hypothetical protein